jgi:hypothetical protein
MTGKILFSVLAFVVIALLLLSMRQARIVHVNRMNRAWNTLQQERLQWQRVQLELAAASRPSMYRPLTNDDWSAAVDQMELNALSLDALGPRIHD